MKLQVQNNIKVILPRHEYTVYTPQYSRCIVCNVDHIEKLTFYDIQQQFFFPKTTFLLLWIQRTHHSFHSNVSFLWYKGISMTNDHGKVCGLSRVIGTFWKDKWLFFFHFIFHFYFQCCEHHRWNLHCIGVAAENCQNICINIPLKVSENILFFL